MIATNGRIGPEIPPVPEGIKRPRWSVMIPTYNCARFLGQTLKSVLQLDPNPDEMEIVVVDDVSQKDDPEAVVREVGKGRVRFERNPENLGAVRNFNRCISLSRGHLIHILHGDDFVVGNFYQIVGEMARAQTNCAFYATRTIAMDEEGIPLWITERLKPLEQPSRDVSHLVMAQHFQTPSVVVKRSFYECRGGFDDALVHCADWEMWVRAIHSGGGVVNPEPLARYRIFDANDSGRLAKTGENVRDRLRLVPRFRGLPGFDEKRFVQGCAQIALTQAHRFSALGESTAAANNLRLYRQTETVSRRIVHGARQSVRDVKTMVSTVGRFR